MFGERYVVYGYRHDEQLRFANLRWTPKRHLHRWQPLEEHSPQM